MSLKGECDKITAVSIITILSFTRNHPQAITICVCAKYVQNMCCALEATSYICVISLYYAMVLN